MSTGSVMTLESGRGRFLTRAGSFIELTKPRIAVLVLITVAVAALVAKRSLPDAFLLLHALIGTTFVAGSASALNQWIERHSDRLMARTANRPIPSGRVSAAEVFWFGLSLISIGLVYLASLVGFATAGWAGLTWLLYVCVYTPLKRRTSLNTLVGAIPGALPVLIGWSAVGGALDRRAFALFLVVFLWQFPHFMAIAWIYRKQYGDAGLKMATVVEPTGRRAGIQAVLAALSLLLVSLVTSFEYPWVVAYLLGAFALGSFQLAMAVRFLFRRDDRSARLLLRASLIYLPVLLILQAIEPFL